MIDRKNDFVKYIGTIDFIDDYYEVCRTASGGKYYLEAGTFTNTGFLACYSIEYDKDETLDSNLVRLYEYVEETREADAEAWREFEAESF